MGSKAEHALGSFASEMDELLPKFAVQTHQLDAIRNPYTPAHSLANGGSEVPAIVRSIQLWTRDPRIAKRVNDALAKPAAGIAH